MLEGARQLFFVVRNSQKASVVLALGLISNSTMVPYSPYRILDSKTNFLKSDVSRHWAHRSPRTLLKGSWDLVTRVINKVTILISTYNPN